MKLHVKVVSARRAHTIESKLYTLRGLHTFNNSFFLPLLNFIIYSFGIEWPVWTGAFVTIAIWIIMINPLCTRCDAHRASGAQQLHDQDTNMIQWTTHIAIHVITFAFGCTSHKSVMSWHTEDRTSNTWRQRHFKLKFIHMMKSVRCIELHTEIFSCYIAGAMWFEFKWKLLRNSEQRTKQRRRNKQNYVG